jgi:uncharacterized SAM-binding protein YcdF (DUF218 family)
MGLMIFGVGCIVYFIAVALYTGIDNGFTYFWLVLGLACFVMTFIMYYMNKRNLSMPLTMKKWLVGFLVLGLVVFVLLQGVLIYHANRKPNPDADYMVVLGAKVNGTVVSKTLKRRLDAAIDYVKVNVNTRIIVSGGQGQGEDVSEAFAMNNYLINNGIPEDRILLEDRSTNTNENIEFSKKLIIEEVGDGEALEQRIIIVSNGFHIYRGTSIAKKNGFRKVEGLGATTDRTLIINYYVREAMAVVKDKVMGNM